MGGRPLRLFLRQEFPLVPGSCPIYILMYPRGGFRAFWYEQKTGRNLLGCALSIDDMRESVYFTSSKLAATDYQQLTETLVQIRNAISILNVINQQISRSIRVMLFLFFLVLLYIPFVCAKVRIKSDKQKNVAKLLADRRFRKMAWKNERQKKQWKSQVRTSQRYQFVTMPKTGYDEVGRI